MRSSLRKGNAEPESSGTDDDAQGAGDNLPSPSTDGKRGGAKEKKNQKKKKGE